MNETNTNEGTETFTSNNPILPQRIEEESVKNEPYRNSLEADIREELDKIRNISYLAVPVNVVCGKGRTYSDFKYVVQVCT